MITQKWSVATLLVTSYLLSSCSAALLPNAIALKEHHKTETCPNYSFRCPECDEGDTCAYPITDDCPEAGIPMCKQPECLVDMLCPLKAAPCPEECPHSCRYDGPPCCPFLGKPICEVCDTLVPCSVTPCPEDCKDDCFYPNADICCPKSGEPICRAKLQPGMEADVSQPAFSSMSASSAPESTSLAMPAKSSEVLSISAEATSEQGKHDKREFMPYSPDGAIHGYPPPPYPYGPVEGAYGPPYGQPGYNGNYSPYRGYPDLMPGGYPPRGHGKNHWWPMSHSYHHGQKPVTVSFVDPDDCPKTVTKTLVEVSYVTPPQSVHTPWQSTKTRSIVRPTTLTTTMTTTYTTLYTTLYSYAHGRGHGHGHGHGNWHGHGHGHGGEGEGCPPCAPIPQPPPGSNCEIVYNPEECCPYMECTNKPTPITTIIPTTSIVPPTETDGVTCADYIILCPAECPNDCVYPSDVPCPYQHTPTCRPKPEGEDCLTPVALPSTTQSMTAYTSDGPKPTTSPVICPMVMYMCPPECPDNCIRPDVPCPYAVPPHCPAPDQVIPTPEPSSAPSHSENEPPYMTHVLCPDYMIGCPKCDVDEMCVRSTAGACPNTNPPYCVPVGSSLPSHVSPVWPSKHRILRDDQAQAPEAQAPEAQAQSEQPLVKEVTPLAEKTDRSTESTLPQGYTPSEETAQADELSLSEETAQIEENSQPEQMAVSSEEMCDKVGLAALIGTTSGSSPNCDKQCEDIQCDEGCAYCCIYSSEEDCCSRAICIQ